MDFGRAVGALATLVRPIGSAREDCSDGGELSDEQERGTRKRANSSPRSPAPGSLQKRARGGSENRHVPRPASQHLSKFTLRCLHRPSPPAIARVPATLRTSPFPHGTRELGPSAAQTGPSRTARPGRPAGDPRAFPMLPRARLASRCQTAIASPTCNARPRRR
jgi:hypothetical protein